MQQGGPISPGAWAMAGEHLKHQRESGHGAAPRSGYSRGSGCPSARKAACEPQLSGAARLSVLPAATRRGRARDAVVVTYSSAKFTAGTERVFNGRVVLSTLLYLFFFPILVKQVWVSLLTCCSNECFNCFVTCGQRARNKKSVGFGLCCCSVRAEGTPRGDKSAGQGAGQWFSELFEGRRGLRVGERLQAGSANPLWDLWAKLP